MAKFLPQFLKIVVVFRDDVLGDGFVAAVGFVKEHALVEEPAEERPEQLRLLDAGPQLAHEFAAHSTITSLLADTCRSPRPLLIIAIIVMIKKIAKRVALYHITII